MGGGVGVEVGAGDGAGMDVGKGVRAGAVGVGAMVSVGAGEEVGLRAVSQLDVREKIAIDRIRVRTAVRFARTLAQFTLGITNPP